MFCKQKGYLEEELDYRKQALDQAYMVSVCVYFHYVGSDSIPNWGKILNILYI